MSAEKEIVNFWYNKKGFFTINNIKTTHNKDAGILAVKFNNGQTDKIMHVQIACSITSNIAEAKDIDKSVEEIIGEKFGEAKVDMAIESSIRQFSAGSQKIMRVIVLGAMPKSGKEIIINNFGLSGIDVIEFEDILFDVFEQLDTQYYKNDIIRTLQLTKYLLLGEPSKMASLLSNENFGPSSRKEFISQILGKDEIVKEFRKTNTERLGAIIKSSGIKPNELAKMLESGLLNKRARKSFMDSLMEQESIRKLTKPKKAKKTEMELGRFF